MERIKIKDLPEDLQAWFSNVAGNKRTGFTIYGYNDRFVVIKKLVSVYKQPVTNLQKKFYETYVIEWSRHQGLKVFLFKVTGNMIKSHKAKIKKDFSIEL